MPQMDGIEATQKLRALGYKGAIVALTANALTGYNEMFMQNGFDGFISKPVDMRQMNSMLNKFVRDKHLEEAVKYKPETVAKTDKTKINPKILQAFCSDAEKAITTFKETVVSGNMKLFTITAHAMKSALANVGEHEASTQASALEDAGLNNDIGYISINIEGFIKTLEALIDTFKPVAATSENSANISEDIKYLMEQLLIVKGACEDYDDDTAYAALDRLNEKPWLPKTVNALEQIRDALFIHSDFDKAAAISEELLERGRI
jgi:CheY-like chemotaxis protein